MNSLTANPALAASAGSPALTDWAESEVQHALFALAAEEAGRWNPVNEYFYALWFESHIHSNHMLLKIGITNNIVQRLRNHRSSFPGWRIVAMLELDHPRETELWWKKFLQPWSYKGSPEVFFLPDEEFMFFTATISWFSMWEDLGLNVNPEDLRQVCLEKRLLALAEACGWDLANAV